MKFTGQGRDQETADPTTLAGLDWFNARYMSSMQGRFQSADPANAGASPADPQTWNGYAYVNNNPLTFTDPTGEGIFAWIGGIIGGFFGGPGGAFWGAQIGNGIDAAVFGPDSTKFAGAPDITGGLLGSGGPLSPGSINSGQWSEQSPLGGGGSLQGGIGRGLIIQNYAEPSTEFFAGAGDSLTWNATWWARKGMGTNDIIDFNSSAYRRGAYLGSGVGLMLNVGGAMKVAAKGAMEVAVGRGDLLSSPIHVTFKVGKQWMHANGEQLFKMKFRTTGAEELSKEAFWRFKVPIRYPSAVEQMAVCRAPALSCVSGAFHAFLKGWGW